MNSPPLLEQARPYVEELSGDDEDTPTQTQSIELLKAIDLALARYSKEFAIAEESQRAKAARTP
jgi:hypothetical protein